MKILHVNMMLDAVNGGGTAERTFQLARAMARRGVKSGVLTLDIGLSPERIASLAPATATVLHCVAQRYFLFKWPEPKIGEAVRWADLVHLVGHWTLLNAAAFREARRQGKPYAVCPAGALPIFGRSRHMKRAYNALIGRRMIREADACIAIGTNETAQFAEYGVASGRLTFIPNGIDPADFQSADSKGFRTRFNLPPGPFILFLGRLNLIKGPDLLLLAFRDIAGSHPDVHLVFAGPDGGMLGNLQRMTGEFGLQHRVHFIGPVEGKIKSQAYHAATLLAVPSRQEAMSIVALEGGISGTPVVMTDQCGFDEIATSGGATVVPATPLGLAHGLETMLSRPDALPGMGAALREWISSRYLWERVADQYIELFSRVTASRPSA